MLRQALLSLLIASAFLATSCAPPAAPDNRAADEAALKAMDEQWLATAGKHDLDGTVAFYADDAVLLPPNGPIAKDAKSIREVWAPMVAPNATISWKVAKTEASKSGDIGYAYGSYQLSIQDPKAPVNDTGKFLEIWKKQADGKWKCIVDTFNSDLPLPAPPPAKK